MRIVVLVIVSLGTITLAHADSRGEAEAEAATLRTMLREHPLYPQDTPDALRRRARTRRITGGLLLGFGLASAVGGMITAFGSSGADALASLGCDSEPCTQAHRYERVTEAGGALLGVGVASAIAGGTLFSLGNADRREARTLELSLRADARRDGGALVLQGRF
jgi:hypothetical protein